jgi:hypothetical protein
MKFKMALPWKPRYQYNRVGWCPLLLCNGNSSYYSYYSSFFCINFVQHVSRRCLDQTLWNLVGISYAMWSCVFKGWFFQNGCRCHGKGLNAKKIERHKNGHSKLLAEQKLMKLDRNNIHIQWYEISQKNHNWLHKLCRSWHGNKKGGNKKVFGFLSSNFMKLCRNIHRSVWQLLGGWKNSKWWPLPW